MKLYTLCLSFLTLASSPSFGLSWGSLLWLGGQKTEVEKPEVVEVVRWRQPVCMLPAAGVQSCLSGLNDLQKEYERVNGKEFEEEQKKFDEFMKDRGSKIYEDVMLDTSDVQSMYKLFEQLRPSEEDVDLQEDDDRLMAKRTVPLPEKIVQKNARDPKYFIASNDKPNLVYVTKVLNAPVTATLVAHNCIPEVGIPLCEDDNSLKNTELSENEPKNEEVDKMKLLEMIVKQQSVVDVIHQMMGKPEESRTEEKYHDDAEPSEISKPNLDKDSKQLQGLELTEIIENNSNDFNREKRHIDPAVFGKFKNFFNKQADTEPTVNEFSAPVMDDVPQHPWWGMIQKQYSAFKKPIFVYQKPFNHSTILEWLIPKMPIEKLILFQDMFQHIQNKKFPPTHSEPVPLTNEGSKSQMSSEKPMNPDNTTTMAASNPLEPVDDAASNI